VKWIGKQHAERDQSDVCDFEVIGELKSNPKYLLLRGCDGRFYAMDPSVGELEHLEPDDSWAMDVPGHTTMRIELSREVIA
jgi:hypothetical protein